MVNQAYSRVPSPSRSRRRARSRKAGAATRLIAPCTKIATAINATKKRMLWRRSRGRDKLRAAMATSTHCAFDSTENTWLPRLVLGADRYVSAKVSVNPERRNENDHRIGNLSR